MTKKSAESGKGEEGFVLAHSLGVLCITGRKTLWEEEEAGHTAPAVRKQREMNAVAQLLLPCVCSLGPQPLVILTRGGLLCSDKPLWKHPPSHLETCFHGDSTSLPAYNGINCHRRCSLSVQPSEHLESSSL